MALDDLISVAKNWSTPLLVGGIALGLLAATPKKTGQSTPPIFSYNNIQGSLPAGVQADNIISEDPIFQDPANGNYRLGEPDNFSPSIAAGNNAYLDIDGDGTRDITSDADGRSRVLNPLGTGDVVDHGAYETPASALPVELTSFTATYTDDTVNLAWTTASETDNAGFDVQRSTDDYFQDIGFVEGNGTTNEEQNYQFVDDNVPFDASTLEYRLRQVDLDGDSELSDVITVQRPDPDQTDIITTYPNPARNQATVQYSTDRSGAATISLYNVLGRKVREIYSGDLSAGNHETTFTTSNLPSGRYFLRLQTNDDVEHHNITVIK